ncbi:type VI secretion system tube protein Hcp [uncultured Oxalicibacterium sp.]|uniref:type VI secretion system tube protein Hcp n=1 Tax=uncultured Oxalicibacterium sp. TaxID=1168540 RepID=UPI0025DBBAD5|nr:type VI secretion system tube protein Hcp [uncultured Oxalicibacterium sp.]
MPKRLPAFPSSVENAIEIILLEPGDPAVLADMDMSHSPNLREDQWLGYNLQTGKYIELVSVHQGVGRPLAMLGDGDAAPSMYPVSIGLTTITCVKYVDTASVKLFEYCLRAQPLGKGKNQPTRMYILRQSEDGATHLITLALYDAIVSQVQVQPQANNQPMEQFELNFTEIAWTSSMQTPALDVSTERDH